MFFHHALKDLNIQELNLATVHGVLLPFLLDHTESRKSVLFADIVSSSPDNSVMLLRDLAQDEWLETEPLMSDLSDAPTMLQFSLQRLFANWKPDRSPLFLSASLSSQIEASTLKHLSIPVKVLRLTDETAQETLAATLGLTPPQLAFRLESAQQHFPYFSLAGSWPGAELDHNLDNVLTLVARGALRHFSRKLVGFESSSPEHLYQNFLSGLSEVRRAGDHLEVRLAKSPLSLILRMAGLQNLRYAPLWLKGMEVWLLPPQE